MRPRIFQHIINQPYLRGAWEKRGRELFHKEDGVNFVMAIGEEPLFEEIYEEIDKLVEEFV